MPDKTLESVVLKLARKSKKIRTALTRELKRASSPRDQVIALLKGDLVGALGASAVKNLLAQIEEFDDEHVKALLEQLTPLAELAENAARPSPKRAKALETLEEVFSDKYRGKFVLMGLYKPQQDKMREQLQEAVYTAKEGGLAEIQSQLNEMLSELKGM